MKKQIIFYLLSLILVAGAEAQQLPFYTQYRSNLFILNPAVAGTKRTIDARVGYRMQWVGYDGAPKTATVSVNSRFMKGKMGAGAYLVEDKIGPTKQTNLGVSYAYHIRFPDCELSAGVGGMFTKYSLVGGDIILHNTHDKAIDQNVTNSTWTPDACAGIYLYNDRFHIGMGALHLMENRATFYKHDSTHNGKVPYRAHLNFTVGYNFAQNPDYIWESTVLAEYVSGVPFMLDYTLRLHIQQKMICGLSLRLHDAVALHLGAMFLDDFQVIYSYDFLISKLRPTNSGSHELMLTYSFMNHKSKHRGHIDTQFIKQKYGYMF